jgi:hypothetical protein
MELKQAAGTRPVSRTEDAVMTGGYDNPRVMPLMAIRFPSAAAAAARLRRDRAFRFENLTRDARRAFPSNYEPGDLREVRICNLVLSSYNVMSGRLKFQFDAAISLLRHDC